MFIPATDKLAGTNFILNPFTQHIRKRNMHILRKAIFMCASIEINNLWRLRLLQVREDYAADTLSYVIVNLSKHFTS